MEANSGDCSRLRRNPLPLLLVWCVCLLQLRCCEPIQHEVFHNWTLAARKQGQYRLRDSTNESLSSQLRQGRINNIAPTAYVSAPGNHQRPSHRPYSDLYSEDRTEKIPLMQSHQHISHTDLGSNHNSNKRRRRHGRYDPIRAGTESDRRLNLLRTNTDSLEKSGSENARNQSKDNDHGNGADKNAARNWIRACYLAENIALEKLDPYLCTHILAFFGVLTDSGKLTVKDADRARLAALTRLRDRRNRRLRVLLSTGGSKDHFAFIASTDSTRASFAASAAALLQQLDLDGLDLDWEFPAYLRPLEEKENFVRLLDTLKLKLKALERPRLLTAAVAGPPTIVLASYDVPRVAAACDLLSVMAYDFHVYSPLLPATGHNAPLFASAQDTSFLRRFNGNYSARLWLRLGVPRRKLLLGIATYGRSWRLRDRRRHGLYAPARGVFASGYTRLPDVCRLLAGNATRVWDADALVPYLYSGDEWVSYDDRHSVAAKALLVRSLDVAGAMTFILDSDDWNNECGGGAFPLHNVVRSILPSAQ